MEYNEVKEKQDPKISIKPSVKEKLDELGKKNESYNDLIKRILEERNGDY